VGRGLQLRLEVFRCEEKEKGWGVRCIDPIPAGTYVTDYIGEILAGEEAEGRGVKRGDEYLFTFDMGGLDHGRWVRREGGREGGRVAL